MEISIRNATEADLPAILTVEQSWPEPGRAGEDKFLARIQKFPQGFFLACINDETGAETVVATITVMPLDYQPATAGNFKSWNQVTHDGYLCAVDLSQCNALYIVSGVIDQRYRGLNIFAPMVLREVELAQSLGLRYVLAGAVIPGYRKYCEKHGNGSAHDYCVTRRGQHLVDPLLAMYEAIGFSVPDERHVLADYYPDDASQNYAALVVRDLEQVPYVSSSGD